MAIDLFCGLGGWTDGLLAEGYEVTGYDIEEHAYGDLRYRGNLIIQDVLTIEGAGLKDAALIVASPPCQKYSYMAMPWSRAKDMAAAIRADETGHQLAELNSLFNACFRIQREASRAAGRHIPLIVENVRGAQDWVGRARWNYGSFYLWGDVPALMPPTLSAAKVPGFRFTGNATTPSPSFQSASVSQHKKTSGHVNKRDGHGHTRHLTNQRESDAVKHGGDWFSDAASPSCQGGRTNGKATTSRKMASAMIAKIPLALSRHIGATFKPVAIGAP